MGGWEGGRVRRWEGGKLGFQGKSLIFLSSYQITMKYEILVGVDHICQLAVPVETFPPGAQSSDWSGCNFTIHNIGLSGQTLYMYMD